MQVVRTMTATLAEKTIQPLYGIIAPAHDFTQYNRDRSESGVVVCLRNVIKHWHLYNV